MREDIKNTGNGILIEMPTGTEIKLEEAGIILWIPKEAVGLYVEAKILDENDKVVKVKKTFSVSQIQKMRKDFLDNVIDGDDYDAVYCLTEKALEDLLDAGLEFAGEEAKGEKEIENQ